MSEFLDDFMEGKKTAEERHIQAALDAARARKPRRDVLTLSEHLFEEEEGCGHGHDHGHDHGAEGGCGGSGSCGGGGCGSSGSGGCHG